MGNSETTSAPRYRSAAFPEPASQSRHGSQFREQMFAQRKTRRREPAGRLLLSTKIQVMVDDRRVLNAVFWVLRAQTLPGATCRRAFDFAIVAYGLCAAIMGNRTIQLSYLIFAYDWSGAVCRPGAGQEGF
jgi:hypothetical protein